MRNAAAFVGEDSGASAAEFALVAVPLLLLLVGTIEYGRLLWTQQSMQTLAASTARCMGVLQSECSSGGTYSADRTRAHLIAQAGALAVPLSAGNIQLDANASCNGVSNFSRVAIDFEFTTVLPRMLLELASGTDLAATACFPNQASS